MTDSRDRRAARLRRGLGAAAVALIVAGTAAAAALVGVQRRDDARRREAAVARAAAATVAGTLDQTVTGLRGSPALVDARGRIDRGDFGAYARDLLGQGGVLGIALAEVLPASRRASFEAATRRPLREIRMAGLRPALARPVYWVVTAAEPPSARSVIGVDVRSDPVRGSAGRAATDAGEPRLASPLPLAEGGQGLAVYKALYRRGAPLRTTADRRAALRGLVIVVYASADLARLVQARVPEGATLQVLDRGQVVIGPPAPLGGGARADALVAGRRWQVVVAGAGGWSVAPAVLVLLVGLALAALVGVAIRIAGRREQAALAGRRDAELLAEAGRRLSGSLDPDAVVAALLAVAVPAVAAACRVDLIGPDGALRTAGTAGGGPGDPGLAGLATRAVDTREAVIAPGGRAVVVPLLARDRPLGAVTFVAGARGGLPAGDLTLVQALAGRGALALDNALLFREREQERGRLAGLVRSLPVGVVEMVPDGEVRLANAEMTRVWRPPDEGGAGSWRPAEGVRRDGRPYADGEWPLDRALAGEEVRGEEVRLRRGDGTWATVMVSATPVRGADGRVVSALATALDVSERRVAQDRLAALQRATAALAAALEPGEVLAATARAARDALRADGALVVALHDGAPDLATMRADPPEVGARLVAAAAGDAAPLAGLLAGGDDAAAAAALVPGATWAAALPLEVGGAPAARLVLARREAPVWDEAEQEYVRTLARLAGDALGRARRYESEHRVAGALQRSLLPGVLPGTPGMRVAVRYLSAAEGTDAGGDWYDVIALPGGRTGLAVGDVVGRGAEAAAVMGQLRSALRAHALEGAGPGAVLERLGRFAESVPGAEVATALYVVVDPDAGEVVYARAGHPPPLVALPDGTTRFLDGARGVPLGVRGPRGAEAREAVPGPCTLLLFTDGAFERRGESVDDGLARLARAAAGAGDDPEEGCRRLLARLHPEGPPQDDVALLVARVDGPVPALRLSVPAVPGELRPMRARLREWLTRAGLGEDDREDVVLAVDEAAANAVEHAYRDLPPGTVEVLGDRDGDGGIALQVRDAGRWRDGGGSPGRGRGIGLMRSVMDEVRVDGGEHGTVVRMRRGRDAGRPVPATAGRPAPGVPVALSGEVDADAADVLRVRLGRVAAGAPVALDLGRVTYLGSAGVRVLLEVADSRGARVTAASGRARRVLELAGVAGRLGLGPREPDGAGTLG